MPDATKILQRALVAQGHHVIVDGVFGTQTMIAVASWCSIHHHPYEESFSFITQSLYQAIIDGAGQ